MSVSRNGMTLLELVVAAALLATITTALSGMIRIAARVADRLTTARAQDRITGAAVRLLHADLLARIQHWRVAAKGAELHLVSFSTLPGESIRARQLVWRIQDGALVRELSGERPEFAVSPPLIFHTSLSSGRFIDGERNIWLSRTGSGRDADGFLLAADW